MNIYLDIDGVLLDTASPEEDIAAFAMYLLDHFPGRVYWLTTHCRGGVNRCEEHLRGRLADTLVDRLAREVLPTDFVTWKTEAIDMTTPFLWFEDFPFAHELRDLEQHSAAASCILMDPRDPFMAQKALETVRHYA